MNERLRAYEERKAVREAKQKGRSLIERLPVGSFLVSVLALTASMVTLYSNVLIKTDQIGVVTNDEPVLNVDEAQGTLTIERETLQVVFINSGSRTAAVINVWALVTQPTEVVPFNKCDLDSSLNATDQTINVKRAIEWPKVQQRFYYHTKQKLVLEPGKIVYEEFPVAKPTPAPNAPPKAGKHKSQAAGNTPEAIQIALSPANEKNDNRSALLCLGFEIAVPTGPLKNVQKAMYRITWPKADPRDVTLENSDEMKDEQINTLIDDVVVWYPFKSPIQKAVNQLLETWNGGTVGRLAINSCDIADPCTFFPLP